MWEVVGGDPPPKDMLRQQQMVSKPRSKDYGSINYRASMLQSWKQSSDKRVRC